ncbi:dihydrodipicolinate synthetase [Paenarthrobacter nicotinovorans]|uniref:dihydrodipicolinate synthase family protein n=1 Tax=Paenarthrobacter nicotinovorans TaxID=29320 RepID=UPI0007CC5630|nr:dihydrodipicolinate synthase family protein [Paenarthrobacter nicotinovorans]GAT88816.1 dihydrodipicolinate synthetase [Paenarthrobacter nicotinovorans]
MNPQNSPVPSAIAEVIRAGAVLPAHPLALDASRRLDPVRQSALTRYYIDAGADGIAIGVHTTQFGIRQHGLYEPVLKLAAETARSWTDRPFALIAGVTGQTAQATIEAETAKYIGYHAVLLNVAALKGRPEQEILKHCREIAAIMPVIGFSLLPEVGGFHLSYDFWREFAAIDNVIAIKMAPFNRYRTLDIVRAVVDARAEDRVTLYTGNDDHIVLDLLAPYRIRRDGEEVNLRVRGGLLGHWSVWTREAVSLLRQIHELPDDAAVPAELLALDSVVTDCNGAIYDALNDFRGCIPGCMEVLRRQGLLDGTWCLDPDEVLSPGQLDEIDRVYRQHPTMHDDEFVKENLQRWLNPAPLVSVSNN